MNAVVDASRRIAAYMYGIVFGTRAERTYGNLPNFRGPSDMEAPTAGHPSSRARAQAQQHNESRWYGQGI